MAVRDFPAYLNSKTQRSSSWQADTPDSFEHWSSIISCRIF